MHLRRAATVLVGSTFLLGSPLVLAGCGGDDVPTKAEFMSAFKESQGAQLAQLESAGIDKSKLNDIIDEWLGCTYDKIKDDEELLRDAAGSADDGGAAKENTAVANQIQEKAASCQADAIKAITALPQASQGG